MEEDFQISVWSIIFIADAIFFFLTAFYVNNVIRNKPVGAGLVALMQNFCSYVALYFFVRNLEYILPACAAAFAGTWAAIKYDGYQQKNQKDEIAELRAELEELRKEVEKLKKEDKQKLKKIASL